jgi:hypothetical protein
VISQGGSGLAFETLAKLGGGGGGALQAEAARGVSEAYGAEGVSEEAKIAALPRVLGFSLGASTVDVPKAVADQREILHRMTRAGSVVGASSYRFGRQADLASYGENM